MLDAPHPQTSGRSLFLGDIENLGWDPQLKTLTPERVQTTCFGVRRALWPFQPQEVVASSHYFAEMVWFHWDRPARRLVGSGPDGADLKLLVSSVLNCGEPIICSCGLDTKDELPLQLIWSRCLKVSQRSLKGKQPQITSIRYYVDLA